MSKCDGKSAHVAHALVLVGAVMEEPLEVMDLELRPPLEVVWGVTHLFVSLVLHGFYMLGLV